MPDRRKHRSADPADRLAFSAEHVPRLRSATADLSWLLGRGYGDRAALSLVGDRYELTARQRQAVARCACADELRDELARRRVPLERLRGKSVTIDGFNVLVTLEAALGGGVVLLARDGCVRDVSGVHGTWRRTEQTRPALERIGRWLEGESPAACTWVLDRRVSNVGRLRDLLGEVAAPAQQAGQVGGRERIGQAVGQQ